MRAAYIFLSLFLSGGLNASDLDSALVSIYAVDCETDKVLINEKGDLSMIPASCMKLVTTAAALYLLQETYRFETTLEYSGSIDPTKTLQGHIYIKGHGDPCLGSDRIQEALSWNKQIELWADQIENLGIRKIAGSVIGDATAWEASLASPSWSWEDLGNYYGAGACALSFHENMYTLTYKPASQVGQKATLIRIDVPLTSMEIKSEVTTGPVGSGDQACIYGSEYSPIQFIRGSIPSGVDEFAIKGAISDPAKLASTLLTQELKKRGIAVQEKPLSIPESRTPFFVSYSPTLQQIVHWTNQKSINLYAEHLLKKIGELQLHEGSTRAGTQAVTRFWKDQKIDLKGFHMADGSGLSRKNLITAHQLVHILTHMKRSPYANLFTLSLPQRGELIKAKSGSMSFVKGYAGYAGRIAFAILVNHCTDPVLVNKTIESFFERLKKL